MISEVFYDLKFELSGLNVPVVIQFLSTAVDNGCQKKPNTIHWLARRPRLLVKRSRARVLQFHNQFQESVEGRQCHGWQPRIFSLGLVDENAVNQWTTKMRRSAEALMAVDAIITMQATTTVHMTELHQCHADKHRLHHEVERRLWHEAELWKVGPESALYSHTKLCSLTQLCSLTHDGEVQIRKKCVEMMR